MAGADPGDGGGVDGGTLERPRFVVLPGGVATPALGPPSETTPVEAPAPAPRHDTVHGLVGLYREYYSGVLSIFPQAVTC